MGYSINKSFWHKGICTEACQAVIDILKQANIPYITATHDVNNPRSGKVMQAVGMEYKYSYEELWQPKNFLECIHSISMETEIEYIGNIGINILFIL